MKYLLRPSVIILVLLFAWSLVVIVTGVPEFILPSPQSVFLRIVAIYPVLLNHALITFSEIVLGLCLGLTMGLFFALQMLLFSPVRLWLLPILVASQAVPVFAVAPILVLWLGYGMGSKVVMAALIIFFPVTMTCFDGLRHTPPGYMDLAKSLGISRLQLLFRIRLPAALPTMASGFRVAVVVAPIGAIVGEWVGSSGGLGYFMLQANARMQIADMFSALFVLAVFSQILYYSTDFLLKMAIPWHREQR